jgi:hypothetical protein
MLTSTPAALKCLPYPHIAPTNDGAHDLSPYGTDIYRGKVRADFCILRYTPFMSDENLHAR